jgi:DNA-binding transcriptional LysR family regulator
LLKLFFKKNPDVSLTLSTEILNGSRDALISGRTQLVVGAFSELPTEAQYEYLYLGDLPFVFAISPQHPLAKIKGPLKAADILKHRLVVIPDTSRHIAKASSGYKPDQKYLLVSSMEEKVKMHVAGLGVGFLPYPSIASLLQKGSLVEKKVERRKENGRIYLAWKTKNLSPSLKSLIAILKNNKADLGLKSL